MIGRVPDKELKEAYASADVFAFASLHESFGIVFIEAAAMGLPIVSIPVGVAPEIIQHGKTGFLVNSCDETFARAISEVLGDPAFKKNAESLRSDLLSKYSWEKVMDSIEKIYRNAIERRE